VAAQPSHTIDFRLRGVFRKVGISSRTQLGSPQPSLRERKRR
jgi:hypothetical protein